MDQLDKTHRLGISIISLCCSLIFAVGVGFLFYRSEATPISFRVLGDPRPLAGASTAFRISAWNSKLRTALPVQISRATLRSVTGAGGAEGQVQPSLPELGALLRFPNLDLPPGEALLELELAAEGQGPRLLSVPLHLTDAGLRPDRWLRPAQAHELALEDRPLWLRPPGGVVLGDRQSPFLLRLPQAPTKETLYWSLDESAPQALPLEQGLGRLQLEINRPLHQLRLASNPQLAGAAHRAWMVAVEGYLRGEREVPPPLDGYQCGFGIWLDADGRGRYGTRPAFQSIQALHQRVHALVVVLCELRGQGRGLEVSAGLEELRGLQAAVLEQLKTLVQANPA